MPPIEAAPSSTATTEKGGEDSLRRLMLLIAAGSLWLFLAAVPVFADGGPHVAAINNGTGGVNADSCAGCHRAHTAQGLYLLVESSGTALCTSCHGDCRHRRDDQRRARHPVHPRHGRRAWHHAPRVPARGWLRYGPYRVRPGRTRWRRRARHGVSQRAKVPVRTAGSQPVTSAHLPNVGGVVGAADGVAWGNGPNSATAYAGPEVELECGTCHNPHGNGQYRILNPIPAPVSTGTDDIRRGRHRGPRHRRGAPARRRHAQLHHHPDAERHGHAPREPGSGPRRRGHGR